MLFNLIFFVVFVLVFWRDREFWRLAGLTLTLTIIVFTVVHCTGVDQ